MQGKYYKKDVCSPSMSRAHILIKAQNHVLNWPTTLILQDIRVGNQTGQTLILCKGLAFIKVNPQISEEMHNKHRTAWLKSVEHQKKLHTGRDFHQTNLAVAFLLRLPGSAYSPHEWEEAAWLHVLPLRNSSIHLWKTPHQTLGNPNGYQ